MQVEARALVSRLTPVCTQLLENAAALANARQHREVTVEHLLCSMLEAANSDGARLLDHFGQSADTVRGRLQQILARMHTGAARPVLADRLLHWLTDAWLFASVEQGADKLRSGALLMQLVRAPGRYTAERLPELEALSVAEMSAALTTALQDSPEAAATTTSVVASEERAALERFTTSFTERAALGELDPVLGRIEEVRQLLDILCRRRKNNPVIVGEPGVGKTALVEGLARAIVEGTVPDSLRNVDVRGLDIGLLQAGASVRGEFEARLQAVISAVKASTKPIVLFIDEAHTLIGAGNNAGGSDAANLLKPELARGTLRTIAATTWSEYKRYFEKDAALERRFQPVKVDEPSIPVAIDMLRGLAPRYARAHGVAIRDSAVVAAVELSARYVTGRRLPDKAIDLLDTAAARVRVAQVAQPVPLADLHAREAAQAREQDALTQDSALGYDVQSTLLDDLSRRRDETRAQLSQMEESWRQARDGLRELSAARAAVASAPSDAPTAQEPRDLLRQCLRDLASSEALLHHDVDADAVARVVASWTGVPLGNMYRDSLSTALRLEDVLAKRVRGQAAALQCIGDTMRAAAAGLRSPTAPLGVLLFVGPSGVGKTEAALALAEAVFGAERFLTTINMSEFQEKHTISRLIGSPPGYVGFGQGGVLTEAVRQRPYSLVLLDECEKADLEVMNLFHGVFDKGTMSDGEGRPIDFSNTLIVLTSNLGADVISRMHASNSEPTHAQLVEAIRPMLARHFKASLLGRMTPVPFVPLRRELMMEVAAMKLQAIAERMRKAHDATLVFDEKVAAHLVSLCGDADTGARALDLVVRSSLLPTLARAVLGHIIDGRPIQRVHVALDAQDAWKVGVS